MALIVQKFGGTSVADVEHIQNAARRIAYEHKRGHQVVAVVSAMAGVTNQLVSYVQAATPNPHVTEYDVVVSAGEQITSGLLALALQNFQIDARSYQGWQLPIQTNDDHSKAMIEEISTDCLKNDLDQGRVPIVAGFQGRSTTGRITTFGRGGSDITAVALAAALSAERCDLYKDVSGIFTADPRIVPQARKLDCVSYEEMLELASQGSKVLQHRAVELAMVYTIPLRVFSSFEESTGTEIMHEDRMIEKALIHGVTCTSNEAKITLTPRRAEPQALAQILGALTDHAIHMDMIVQSHTGPETSTPLTFTIPNHDLPKAQKILKDLDPLYLEGEILINRAVAKVSVVGVGLRNHSYLTGILFRTLAHHGIDILGISTSEIKISILVDQDFTELTIRLLHAAYQLEKPAAAQPKMYAVS